MRAEGRGQHRQSSLGATQTDAHLLLAALLPGDRCPLGCIRLRQLHLGREQEGGRLEVVVLLEPLACRPPAGQRPPCCLAPSLAPLTVTKLQGCTQWLNNWTQFPLCTLAMSTSRSRLSLNRYTRELNRPGQHRSSTGYLDNVCDIDWRPRRTRQFPSTVQHPTFSLLAMPCWRSSATHTGQLHPRAHSHDTYW